MSPSISCSEILQAARNGEEIPVELLRNLGAESASEFFRRVVEPLSDSFESADSMVYGHLMRAWDLVGPSSKPELPENADGVYVLSRVTLGADIKIVSPILDAMKRRFPASRIVFVGNRKSAELFECDSRIEHLEANYPRSGSVAERIGFAEQLRRQFAGPKVIVIDPDSRISQLGLVPLCDPSRHFHFPSRTVGGDGPANLTSLVQSWLLEMFRIQGKAYIAPAAQAADAPHFAAVSLGVGGNDSKRLPGNFEARLLGELGSQFPALWVDRGAGGEEARRVTAAVEASGVANKVRYWEGSFAAFASIISQSRFYAGYDSAGQHAAAACGVPLFSVFAGAPSERFENRWTPSGPGTVHSVSIRTHSADECIAELAKATAMIKL